jgi:hypothetical protein
VCKSLLGVALMLGTWDVDAVVELVFTKQANCPVSHSRCEEETSEIGRYLLMSA